MCRWGCQGWSMDANVSSVHCEKTVLCLHPHTACRSAERWDGVGQPRLCAVCSGTCCEQWCRLENGWKHRRQSAVGALCVLSCCGNSGRMAFVATDIGRSGITHSNQLRGGGTDWEVQEVGWREEESFQEFFIVVVVCGTTEL